ncbi:DUF5518 domain-containing protein [Natronolimnobius sp. AArcel1]|uniref:DUF5518 domain-containing protein n=1 Tax=Natronolimnobius sp. AArcel1 TaxID=1679093 RepID=UPI0013ECE80B|nr:DUF5518 domain-containing protein [Natronolimnobius sp. AArcel1]NGM68971.1 DUF5518 domain-containing protein [Natronolimnobius sp. AArcel1]
MSESTNKGGEGTGKLLKAILAGVIVTKIVYFIPVVQIGAPLLGGATTAYIINRGPLGGLKSGFLKGLAMTFPAIILGVFFAGMVADVPFLGDLLAGSLIVLVGIIVIHSVTLGMIGGLVSGWIAQKVRTTPVPTDQTVKKTAEAANTVDNVKDTYSEHRNAKSDVDDTTERTSAAANDADSDDVTEETRSKPNASIPSTSKGRPTSADREQDRTPTHGERSGSAPWSNGQPCSACGETVSTNASFCPACGVESPLESTAEKSHSNAESNSSLRTAGTNAQGPQRKQGHEDDESGDDTEPSVAATAAETVAEHERPESAVASQLCRTLSDSDASSDRVETVLSDAVAVIDSAVAVIDAVDAIDDPSSSRELESARRRLTGTNGDLATALVPVFERGREREETLETVERKREQLREAAKKLCQEAEQADDLTIRSTDIESRTAELARALERNEIVFAASGADESVTETIAEFERSARPQSAQSRELLEVLGGGHSNELTDVLRATIDSLDEFADLQAAIADIGERDVRRRLDSLDGELQREEGAVYRHLADRVRELEAMVDRNEIDDVQLYAIYQESTFYDRTLLPRLSRARPSDGSVDFDRLTTAVDRRIETIEDEYITVRADHNHTIPKHFLSLAAELRNEAAALEGRQPEQAAGVLSASEELLDYIEQLYERNEYSVMLRRLRG